MALIDPDDGTVNQATGLIPTDRLFLFRVSGGKFYINPAFFVSRANHTGTQSRTTISDFDAGVSANATVSNNTTLANTAQSTADTANTNAGTALSAANAAQSAVDAVEVKTDQITITAATDLDAIRTKVNGIGITDNQNIITNAQIAQLLRFSRSEAKQSLSGATPNLNCDNGYNADFPMTVNAVINITNVPAGLVSGGQVILRDTNGYTVSMTLAGSSTNVAKMVGAEDLPAGVSDTAILTWIYDGTYLTYNVGKRTEA